MVEVYPTIEPVSDKVYRLAEAVAGLVPAGSTILQSIITSPVQRRMEAWIEGVERRLAVLVHSGRVDLDELMARREFSALILRTLKVAAATSQREQLECLQNFAVNVALKPDMSEDEQFILLDTISSYTPSHVKVLLFYHDPSPYMSLVSEFRRTIADNEFPQGQELAFVLQEGDAYFWQNVFYLVARHNVITNHRTAISEEIPDVYVNGRGTEMGRKVVAMLCRQDKPRSGKSG